MSLGLTCCGQKDKKDTHSRNIKSSFMPTFSRIIRRAIKALFAGGVGGAGKQHSHSLSSRRRQRKRGKLSHEDETLMAANRSSDSGDRGAASGWDAFTIHSAVELAEGMCRSHDAMEELLSLVGPLLCGLRSVSLER